MTLVPVLTEKLDLLFQRKLNRRELIWLRMMLEDFGFYPSGHSIDSFDHRKEMADFISKYWWKERSAPFNSWADSKQWGDDISRAPSLKKFWREVGTYLDQNLLQNSSFDWIAATGRQAMWLLRELEKSNMLLPDFTEQRSKSRILRQTNVAGLNDKETLIARLDYSSKRLENKLRTLNHLREDWDVKQINEKPFSWYTIDRRQEKQKCECAWLWYSTKKDPQRTSIRSPPKLSTLEDVLTYIDSVGYSTEEALYHLEQIKKKFKAQQVAANRKNKTQTNLAISNETRKMLDTLARQHRMTKADIVELLIQNAHERGMLN